MKITSAECQQIVEGVDEMGGELHMFEQGSVTIPATDWESFENWDSQPGKVIPSLRELAARPQTWEPYIHDVRISDSKLSLGGDQV
jgi:hypothetical protein